MEILEFLLLSIETGLVSLSMKIMSIFIAIVIYGRMIELYFVWSVVLIPFATMTNREWGQVGNNYLKSLFALGFQDFLIMVCVRIYAVLVKVMTLSDNLHIAIFSLVAYIVLLCFMLLKSSAISKSIFGRISPNGKEGSEQSVKNITLSMLIRRGGRKEARYSSWSRPKAYRADCFHRGFGTFPKGLPQQALACEGTSKISIAGTAENRDFYGKGTPFLCLLFHLFLNLYNNGKRGFANFHIIMCFWFLSWFLDIRLVFLLPLLFNKNNN